MSTACSRKTALPYLAPLAFNRAEKLFFALNQHKNSAIAQGGHSRNTEISGFR